MNDPKIYLANCESNHEFGDFPDAAMFSIDAAGAAEIGRLSAIVKANSLQSLERFDLRVDWLKNRPCSDDTDGAKDTLPTECDTLCITESEFWFSAFLKHSTIDVRTQRQPIAALLQHFGLEVSNAPSATAMVAANFVNTFRNEIEQDLEINGADAVDQIRGFYQDFTKALKQDHLTNLI